MASGDFADETEDSRAHCLLQGCLSRVHTGSVRHEEPLLCGTISGSVQSHVSAQAPAMKRWPPAAQRCTGYLRKRGIPAARRRTKQCETIDFHVGGFRKTSGNVLI